ncbi:MAG: hypothetical protein NTV46_00515 [Verrucomicrobia bacterium]|nr:hypothetical protein [Verrucomicrobiota bacterium]
MKNRLFLKLIALLAVVTVGVWFYLTEFQRFRVRRILDQAHEELVSGRMDVHRIVSLDVALSNISGSALIPSVKKYADSYAYEYSQSGDPEKFAAGVLIGRPDLRWANGIGRSITIPLCIMLLEDAKKYPPKTRAYMEEVACTLLPKATGQSFGVNGITFLDAAEERATAIEHWHEWYQTNKHAVLERDQRVNSAVEAQIGQQKKFVEGVLNLNKRGEQAAPSDGDKPSN